MFERIFSDPWIISICITNGLAMLSIYISLKKHGTTPVILFISFLCVVVIANTAFQINKYIDDDTIAKREGFLAVRGKIVSEDSNNDIKDIKNDILKLTDLVMKIDNKICMPNKND